jgi:hypothetical protein
VIFFTFFYEIILILRLTSRVWHVSLSRLGFFLFVFLRLIFFLSFNIELVLELSFIIFLIFPSIRLCYSHYPTHRVWQTYTGLFVFFLLIDFFLISSFYIWIIRNWTLYFFYQFSFYKVILVLQPKSKFASNLPNKFIFFVNRGFFSLYLASLTYTFQYKI